MAVRYPVDQRTLSAEDHVILKVLHLYYEHDLTQAEVGARMGFSRPKVSKLIAEGRERGLVKIEIAEPADDLVPLEISLEDRYRLREAVVVATSEDRGTTELSAGRAGAALLTRGCTAETILGLSWGVSVRALADATLQRAFVCKKVVPLVGGMGKAQDQLHSNQVCADLAEKLDVECLHLAALAGIEDTLAEGAACGVAVMGIGGILPSSTMVEAGYFTLDEFLGLKECGIVGDVCCHFLDAEGKARYPELSERIVGLTPDELRAIGRTVGIATGPEKAPGVAAVLRGGFIKALVCDRVLALSLLDISSLGGTPVGQR